MPTLQQLADLLKVTCPSHGDRELRGVSSLVDATPTDLSILSADRYVPQYKSTNAGAVLAGKKLRFHVRADVPVLLVDDPDLALIQVLERLAPPIPHPAPGVHASAVVSTTATLGENASVGPNVVIGERTRIGRNTRLHAGVVVSDDVVIGDDCILFPNVVVRERCTLGSRVIIHSNSAIGTDGFGYKWDGRKHAKIPQIGVVVIEDDVEIGSCVCVDRAKFDETRIGRGTKIDNLVQIAHNVRIGQHSVLCGQAGVAGTATIGSGVVIGGASCVRDHVTVGDGVMAAGHTLVVDNIEPKAIISGMYGLPHRQNLREQAVMRRLPELLVAMRKLQEEVEALKQQQNAK